MTLGQSLMGLNTFTGESNLALHIYLYLRSVYHMHRYNITKVAGFWSYSLLVRGDCKVRGLNSHVALQELKNHIQASVGITGDRGGINFNYPAKAR